MYFHAVSRATPFIDKFDYFAFALGRQENALIERWGVYAWFLIKYEDILVFLNMKYTGTESTLGYSCSMHIWAMCVTAG